MSSENKPLQRNEGWYHVRESGGSGHTRREWNVTVGLEYGGMDFTALRETMDRIESEHGDKFDKFKLELEMVPEPYTDDKDPYIYVLGWRKETDSEFQARADKENARQKRIQESERKQYEALKKKFES